MIARRRRGIILILVLIVVAILALASLGFSELMLSERKAAQTSGRQVQARAMAQSGAELARQFLDREVQSQVDAGGSYDNAQRFSDVLVVDDETPEERGHFSIIAPRIEDRTITGIRFGLEDESTRINLAVLQAEPFKDKSKDMLMGLPGMTDSIAEAILDWMDEGETSRPQGAGADYYGSLMPPYAPRKGPPATIEELLLVRGVTPQLLFGADAARLGLVAAGSSAEGGIEGVDNSDGTMDHGWAAYLTLHSAESTLKADGTKKINLNDTDLKKLYDALEKAFDKETARFIVAHRQNPGAKVNHAHELDLTQPSKATLQTVLHLIGAPTVMASPPTGPKVPIPNPFPPDTGAMNTYLPKLLDNTTVEDEETIPGRININQAPRTVLLCIPGMTADIVDKIIAKRVPDPTTAPEEQKHETWPLGEGIVDLKKMKALLPFITVRGSVYRAQIIGSFEKGGASARLEVILDATKRPTRLLFWKDISRLPGGFPLEMIGRPGATN